MQSWSAANLQAEKQKNNLFKEHSKDVTRWSICFWDTVEYFANKLESDQQDSVDVNHWSYCLYLFYSRILYSSRSVGEHKHVRAPLHAHLYTRGKNSHADKLYFSRQCIENHMWIFPLSVAFCYCRWTKSNTKMFEECKSVKFLCQKQW